MGALTRVTSLSSERVTLSLRAENRTYPFLVRVNCVSREYNLQWPGTLRNEAGLLNRTMGALRVRVWVTTTCRYLLLDTPLTAWLVHVLTLIEESDCTMTLSLRGRTWLT